MQTSAADAVPKVFCSSDASSLSFSVDGFPVGASFSGAAALGERLRLFLPVMLESLWVLYLSRWSGP